ncbi:Gp37-like protein [Microbacterium sp. GXF6406]
MALENGDRVRIELWGPISAAFGNALGSRGVLASDFDLDLTLRYNKNGTAVVTVADDNALIPQIVKRDTDAVIFIDGASVYSGHVEEQTLPLIPGGVVEFVIVDVWEMFLGGSLAWPNPRPSGFAEARSASSTLLRRVDPWTRGGLRPVDRFDIGQSGIPDLSPMYAQRPTLPTYTANGNITAEALAFLGDEFFTNWHSNTGYWNPVWRDYLDQTYLDQNRTHTEASWIQAIVQQNVVQRLGYGARLSVGAHNPLGKLVWYPGGWVEDQVAAAPEDWRYGPLLRFDVIEDAVEEWLDGVDDNSIRARIDWSEGLRRWDLIIDQPSDLSRRVLTVEGGEIIGGSATLSKTPTSDVVVGGSGNGSERAMLGKQSITNANTYGWKREVYEQASGSSPVWKDGSYETPAEKRIPKYHHVETGLSAGVRNAYTATLNAAASKRLEEDRQRDGIDVKLQESEWFRFTPSGFEGYDLGTRVAVRVPNLGVVHERVRSVRITLDQKDGLVIEPTLGDPAATRELAVGLQANSRQIVGILKSR